ncbi:MAG: KilA-N domain-containing protein [Lewinellaceae bacterium]|nr:KilA-N domain-containing protein [Lewinellaceae bacterium]
MAKKAILTVQDTDIAVLSEKNQDFFSLTDIAKRVNQENPAGIVNNWMRTKDTIGFLGTREVLHNPDFNLIEFDKVKNESGTNRFILSASRWVKETCAIGIKTKAGRYGGGTFAHRDIALEFCSWVSPVFKLYVIKEFQRLKEEEADQTKQTLEWNLKRTLAKINYRIHTDAVKEYLIPPRLHNTKFESTFFASEADLLNLALFGMTAQEWRESNPEAKGNVRDYANAEQLLVLANLENLNAEFIKQGLTQEKRLTRLNENAIYQMQLLVNIQGLRVLKGLL